MDLIRGRDVNRALATLQFTRKGVGHDIAKLLRSAAWPMIMEIFVQDHLACHTSITLGATQDNTAGHNTT